MASPPIHTKKDNTLCGTPGFMPPEALKNEGFTCKSDLFSLGSLLFSLLTHQNLFYAPDNKLIMEENRKCRYGDIGMRMKGRSQYEIEFIQALLQKDPKMRPNTEEALNMAIFD